MTCRETGSTSLRTAELGLSEWPPCPSRAPPPARTTTSNRTFRQRVNCMAIKKYIIHLEEQVDRKADFLSTNTAPGDFVWTVGVKGANIDRQALIESGELARNAQIVDGSLGNAISIVQLLRRCIENDEIMTILENDAILAHDFDPCSLRLLESIGFDFDIVQWGWNWDSVLYLFPMSVAFGPMKMTARQNMAEMGFRKFQELKCHRTLIPLGHQWSTHCFTVTPRGAKSLLEGLLPLNTDPFFREDLDLRIQPKSVDSMMGRCYPKLKAYSCFPPLSMVLNDKAKSTIWSESTKDSRNRGFRGLRRRIKKSFSKITGIGHA
jgi:glycosyl transferase, family 25